MEKVIVSGVEQVGDDRHVIATVTEPFATAQQRVESRASATEHMPDHAGLPVVCKKFLLLLLSVKAPIQ